MTTKLGDDVCNFSEIYDSSYSYSFPEGALRNLLDGKGFDNPDPYTPDEIEKLKADINHLFQVMMTNHPVKKRLAVISAGSPGAGKTTLLRQKLEEETNEGRHYPYVCPDDVCLKGQKRTYLADIKEGDGSHEVRKNAYTKWRPGSNAAAHLLLANLIKRKYGFYFGTTCSHEKTGTFFKFLKDQGYEIKILHVSSSDEVRWNSIKERDKTFVQTTEEDVRKKGEMVPQRINDAFLRHADEIEFYYRKEASGAAELAASWRKNTGSPGSAATLEVIDPDAYEGVKAVHNKVIGLLNRPELKWEATVESGSVIYPQKK